MSHSLINSGRQDGVLDVLASRLGLVCVIGLLLCLSAGAGLYTQTVVRQLNQTQTVFEDRQIRNGYVAQSDIHRVVLVAQQGQVLGGLTDELRDEFAFATDILFVRVDHLRSVVARAETFDQGSQSLAALEEIVRLADEAIENDFKELDTLVLKLIAASEKARKHLVKYLDEMRRSADAVMLRQTQIVRKQQLVVLGSLLAVTFVGTVALVFLRREVLGRRARERAEQRVEFLAFYDSLTELPNRVQFQDRLQALLNARDASVALLYIDLDDFKSINDTQGHAAGDIVLRTVGNILADLAKANDGFAARLAGDEFALVVPTTHLPILTELCEKIIETVSSPMLIEGESLEVGVSIGLATTSHVGLQLAQTADGLSRVTDFALYASKSGGRNLYTVYDRALEEKYLERKAMLEELPEAIRNGDLEVFLQPKVALPSGYIFGFEALVRWRRSGNLVAPGEFILLAEESGLVVDIDNHVLSEAARLVSDWNNLNGTNFSVSVNLSTLHFNSSRITQTVEKVLWRSEIPPELLTLEITESLEMRDWSQAQQIIAKLRQLGCRIAIDDFGTGFSSLAYLRSTVVDELKVDRSLVQEIETSEKARLMLGSVFEIAQNLEMEIIVEGIETDDQAEIIYKMGARCAQGYLFGKPIPIDLALCAANRHNAELQRYSEVAAS